MEQRISSLDTLRGVAILMVVIGHYLPGNVISGDAAWHVTSLGRGGVILFFLLSGYLIFWNVERQPSAIFLSRRAFKIFPAYWISAIAIFAAGYFTGEKWSAGALLPNLTMTQDVFGSPLFTGVYWTLLIEVKFYALIVLQYYFLRDRWTVAIPLAMIALNLLILLTRGHASLLLTYLPAFYVGIQARRLERDRWFTGTAFKFTACAVAASLIFFDPYYGWWSCFYLIASSAALSFALSGKFSNRVLNFFGRISYSDYLYHAAVGSLVFAALGAWRVSGLVSVAAAFAASTFVALLSYRLIELPFVKYGKAHEQFWQSRNERQAKERENVALP